MGVSLGEGCGKRRDSGELERGKLLFLPSAANFDRIGALSGQANRNSSPWPSLRPDIAGGRRLRSMRMVLRTGVWIGVAVLGALAFATIALRRGEPINAIWLVAAAVCTYAIGYRFYSKFIAAKVLTL